MTITRRYNSLTATPRSGGFSAVHSQDFAAHYSGGDWNHDASNINLDTSISGLTAVNVQEALEQFVNIVSLNGGFVSIGDGYTGIDPELGIQNDLYYAFQTAFATARLNNLGGVIVIKSGDYVLRRTVIVPKGFTIWGEPGGARITSEVSSGPAFIFSYTDDSIDIGNADDSIVSTKMSRLWNLTLLDNNNGNLDGGPSAYGQELISIEEGCELLLENVTIIGRNFNDRVTTYAVKVALPDGSTPENIPTILHMNKCYIDSVECAIQFNPRTDIASVSELHVSDCRVRTINTSINGYFISTYVSKVFINNNYYIGYTPAGFSNIPMFLYLPSILTDVTVDNAFISLVGNTGGLTIVDDPSSEESNSRSNWIVDDRVNKWEFRLSDLANFWGSVKNNPWYITVGDGVHSIGDITGARALELVNSLVNVDEDYLNSRGEQLVIINPGAYTVSERLILGKIIGNTTNSSVVGTDRKIVITLDSDYQVGSTGVYRHDIGKAENVEFVAANNLQIIYSNLQSEQDFSVFKNVKFINCGVDVTTTSRAIVENCSFNQTGVFSDDIINLKISSTFISIVNSYFYGYGYGIRISNANARVVIDNCHFESSSISIRDIDIINSQVSYLYTNVYNLHINNTTMISPRNLVSSTLLATSSGYRYHLDLNGSNSLVIRNCNITGPDLVGNAPVVPPSSSEKFIYPIICCMLSSEKCVELYDNYIIGGIPVYIDDFSGSGGSGDTGGKIEIHGNEIRHYDVPSEAASLALFINVSEAAYINYPMCVGSAADDEEGRMSTSSINISNNKIQGLLSGTPVCPIDARSSYGTLDVSLVNIRATGWNINVHSNDIVYSGNSTHTFIYSDSGAAMIPTCVSALRIYNKNLDIDGYTDVYGVMKISNNNIMHRNISELSPRFAVINVEGAVAQIVNNSVLTWYCDGSLPERSFINLLTYNRGNLICGNSFNSNFKEAVQQPINVESGYGFVSSNWFDLDNDEYILTGSGANYWVLSSDNYGNFDF